MTELTHERPRNQQAVSMPNVWVYEGEAYDLTDFIKQHPGGGYFIGRMRNRDITIMINIFHPNPEKNKKLLKKYALGRKAVPDDIHPTNGAPAFSFKEGFDSWRDTPKFNFDNKEQLLNGIKVRLNTPEMTKKIAKIDFLFDVITMICFILYILVELLRLKFTPYMPIYLFVPLMVLLRTAISGSGHYLIHRKQVGLNKIFSHCFDLNYIPMAYLATENHSVNHHSFTQHELDPKIKGFTAMLELPLLYRIPLHTLYKLVHIIPGRFVRAISLLFGYNFSTAKDLCGSWQESIPHYIGLFGMRILLFGELILFWIHHDLGAWFIQYFITLWFTTFLVVSSHDFEEAAAKVALIDEQDWAVFQIKNAYDLTMIGNKYIDCFLSAGLASHRVHHVLPYQKSGFANIISEDIVREETEKFNVVWLQPKNFFRERLPILVKTYLFTRSRIAKEKNFGIIKEHLHPQQLLISLKYVTKGFVGL
jgi:Cytochrome b5-like Heme/Steroid binding domain